MHQTPAPLESGMGLVLPPIEAYHVQHLPIVKAYADKIGLVEVINQLVPTEMAIDPGPIVLGIILDTLTPRRPLPRLAQSPTPHAPPPPSAHPPPPPPPPPHPPPRPL